MCLFFYDAITGVGRCKKPVYGIHGELRRLRLRLNQERPQLVYRRFRIVWWINIFRFRFERLCESRITDVAPEPPTCIVKKNGAFLRTNPSIIRFYDYEPGWIYSVCSDFTYNVVLVSCLQKIIPYF